jgi:hypothetical protein
VKAAGDAHVDELISKAVEAGIGEPISRLRLFSSIAS